MIQFFNCSLVFAWLILSVISNGKCFGKQDLNYKGLYSEGVNNYELVIPKRVDENGNFISNLIPHHYKRSTTESDRVFYKLPIAGEECLIQLTPNLMLTAPSAVFEIQRKNKFRFKIISFLLLKIPVEFHCFNSLDVEEIMTKKPNFLPSIHNNTEQEKRVGILDNIEIKRLKNENCYYSGFVRGVNSSRVALSTCFGLAGFIQTKNGTYTIEPVLEFENSSEDEHPHILYQNDSDNREWTVCNTIDLKSNRTVREVKENNNGGNGFASILPMYIEILIVLDKTFVNLSDDFDSENYVLTVFNMASSLFQDASLGYPIRLSLVRVIRLEADEEGLNMNKSQDALKTLENFQDWQFQINPGDDSHPNHHDVAILLTRVESYQNVSYGFLGATTLGSACDKKKSAILCKDSGLRLGFVMAHEIAHLLGVEHDGYNNSCNGTDDYGFRTVMHPQVLLTTEAWSHCTQDYIKAFLERGLGDCLNDEPSEHHFNFQDLPPGTIYDADFQCKQLMISLARECSEGSTCDSLNCHLPGHLCVITKVPPATGTRCGENMWCQQEKCLVVGHRPDAVDGNWGDWSPWSDCSRTCGSGVTRSERICNKPTPSHGGRYCQGPSRRHKICSSRPCDMSQPSFRDVQCGEYDDWIYPEDGLKHPWKEYFIHEGNPCILYCINDNLEVAALKPRVVDGTSCYRGMRDVCIDGECKSIPCDLNFDSGAVEDVCGVCHGDGTTCDFSRGQQSLEKYPRAITRLISVPAGAMNIRVEEVMPSSARILVRDKETRDFYVRGTKLGMYSVPGSEAWLGMLKSRQEALTIPGPVSKPLAIWIERVENVTVKWSMALPATQQRKPVFTWDYVQWSPCSAICGPGVQKSEPSCIEEKAGLVENTFCARLSAPTPKIRFCELAKCQPRWMVTDWKECELVNSTSSVKRRLVRCVKTFGEGEGESSLLPDEDCPKPKPLVELPCDLRSKRDSPNHVIKKKSILDDEMNAMFSSNRIKFGSHKKYDEYLKNFNAIAIPQRKSEKIPLHLLNTPHFKHYYRVLQMPDYSQNQRKIDTSFGKTVSNERVNCKTKVNDIPEVRKNTFSGKRQDYIAREGFQKLLRRGKTNGLVRRCSPREDIVSSQREIFQPASYHTSHAYKKKDKIHSKQPPQCPKNENCRRRRKIRRMDRGIRSIGKREHQWKRKFKYSNLIPLLGYHNQQETEELEEVKPPEKYAIRFGEVMVDKDEDADFEIIVEEGDRNDLMGMEVMRSPGEKLLDLKGEEGIRFMENITSLDLRNATVED